MKNVYFYVGQLASLFKKNSKIKLFRGEEKTITESFWKISSHVDYPILIFN